MKKRYLLLIIPVIIIAIVLILNKNAKNITIKEANYDSAYSKKAINILKSKANDKTITNYEDGNKGEMYAFNHEATYQTPAQTDYRYIGNNPNNYVYFNCTDVRDTSTCEIWRIVGIFEVDDGYGQKEEKIKIIKDDFLNGLFAYDNNGVPDWTQSSLKDYLNETYYNTLSEYSKRLISPSLFYLGPMEGSNHNHGYLYYEQERSKALGYGNNEYEYK